MKKRLLQVGLILLLSLLFISGCKKTPQPAKEELSGVTTYPGNSSRFAVERVAVIYDDLAYANVRGVYILHDNETGKEYVGLSGVGISELGSHMEGKVMRHDER